MYFNELTALIGQELSRAGGGSEKLILARQGGPNEWVVMGGGQGQGNRAVEEGGERMQIAQCIFGRAQDQPAGVHICS